MKPGFLYVAERQDARAALLNIIDTLGTAGVSLVHPVLEQITRLEGDGDAVETSQLELLEGTAKAKELTPKFWFGPDASVACNFRRLTQGIVRHAYSVDGLEPAEIDRLADWTVQYFRRGIAEGTAVSRC